VTAMTYSKYLRLKELLALQHPLTPVDDQDVHDSERLFIVVHQASETLLSQALTDLKHIEANRCGRRCFTHRAERATALIDALEEQLKLLRRTLKPEDFLMFRDRFGTASGLQSAQFHELFAVTDRLACDAHRFAVERRQFEDVRAAVRRWRHTHLELVRHMIGDEPGSGNTSGIGYLEHRLYGSSHAEDCCGAIARDAFVRGGKC
jgi:tryptophan 2,3-dioxygenase